MDELQQICFPDKSDFWQWLQQNHNDSNGIWLLYYKKHTNMECISYDDSVEVALCFGWIDSILKSIDHEKYVRKFTPRIDTKNWSPTNKKRVLKLIECGEMTEVGLNKIDLYLKTGKVDWDIDEPVQKGKTNKNIKAPEYLIKELSRNQPALNNFLNLAPSYQKKYILWITTAKKQDTRDRRIKEAIRALKKDEKLGMK